MAKRTSTKAITVDYAAYARSPIIGIASGLALATALLRAVPSGAAKAVRASARALRGAAKAAQGAWAAQQRSAGATKGGRPGREIDAEADGVWAALRDRLLAWLRLPTSAPRTRAYELLTSVFGKDQGVGFTQLKWPEQLQHMQLLLGRIVTEGLEADLRELAGGAFVDAVRAVMPEYEALVASMTGGDAASADAGAADESPDLLEHVRALQGVIAAHAIQVLATIKPGDADTAKTALAMLKPIDVHRTAHATGGKGLPAVTPTTPLPAAPSATPTTTAQPGATGWGTRAGRLAR